MAVQLIDGELFERVLEEARRAPRRRMNHNFHAGMEENPHRFLNVMLRGTYIRPHRHLNPPKPETFIALEGQVACFLFSEDGRLERRAVLGRGPWREDALGIDLPPGVWHTVAVLTEHAVCFEVKPGPYAAGNDKEFAPWAPAEGDPAAAGWLAGLLGGLT